jgi:hypothetical protein
MSDLKKKDIVYYARIMPSSGIYDVLELKVRTVEEDWFVGIEKRDKQAFLFADTDIDKIIFVDRNKALNLVKTAEANKKETINDEIFYEEY